MGFCGWRTSASYLRCSVSLKKSSSTEQQVEVDAVYRELSFGVKNIDQFIRKFSQECYAVSNC